MKRVGRPHPGKSSKGSKNVQEIKLPVFRAKVQRTNRRGIKISGKGQLKKSHDEKPDRETGIEYGQRSGKRSQNVTRRVPTRIKKDCKQPGEDTGPKDKQNGGRKGKRI